MHQMRRAVEQMRPLSRGMHAGGYAMAQLLLAHSADANLLDQRQLLPLQVP